MRKELIITRCVICMETRSFLNGNSPFINISEAYPVKLHGYVPSKITPGTYDEKLENIFLCKPHYEEIINANKQ